MKILKTLWITLVFAPLALATETTGGGSSGGGGNGFASNVDPQSIVECLGIQIPRLHEEGFFASPVERDQQAPGHLSAQCGLDHVTATCVAQRMYVDANARDIAIVCGIQTLY